MFKDEIQAVAGAAAGKKKLLENNPLGYFLLSMLAGIYVGIGVLLAFTVGGYLSAAGSPMVKIAMGLSFGVALSLVVMAGAELFTGNNMVMAVGTMKKTVTLGDSIKLWVVCWIGNLVGALVLAVLFALAGLATGDVGTFMATSAATKMNLPFVALLVRGILCNFLVCAAVWCGTKMKTEGGKLLMIFWCLFAFITTGFEHSIANMTLLAIGLINPAGAAVSVGGYVYNLVVATLGNMIGGILFIAVPYVIAAKDKQK